MAIVSENRIEWLLTQMGAGAVGAVAVGVYATSPAEEMGYVLEHADIELVVCEDQEQVDKVLQVADRLPGLRRIVVIETRACVPMPSPSARASLPSRRSRKTSGARTSNRGRWMRRWMASAWPISG